MKPTSAPPTTTAASEGGAHAVRAAVPVPPARDPLDHDADGRKGGVAPAPPVQHLVVFRESATRDLRHGEVIAVDDVTARALLKADVCRPATPQEVELAQPRIRAWAA